MPRLRHLITVLLATAAAVAAAAPAHATFPGAPGMFVKGTGGSGAPLIADDPADDRPARPIGSGINPRWSPTGTEVAMQSPHSFNADGMEVRVTKVTGQTRVVHRFDPIAETEKVITGIDWSPDGKWIYMLVTDVTPGGPYPFPRELWKASATGTRGSRIYEWRSDGYEFTNPSVSPDGKQILASRRIADAQNTTLRLDTVRFPSRGGDVTSVPHSAVATGGSRGDWRPDGNGYLITKSGSAATVDVYDRAGEKLMSTGGTWDHARARFTPDGSRIWFSGCVGDACGIVTRRIPDPEADVAPDEPVEALVPGSEGLVNAADWQPQDQPVIFIHGFAGSKIACGDNELWAPTPLNMTEDLTNMRLGADGDSNAPGTCGARPSGLLESAFGGDVYGPAREYVERIAPDRARVLVWDWRRDPRKAFGALNALIDEELASREMADQGVRRVALMAHSMGGILTRTYIDDPARAKRIARAVTIGTPYLGAAKALFPISYGVEVPEGSSLDPLLPPAAFRGLARTMTGLFFLLPNDAYGSWLEVDGLAGDKPLSPGEVEAYIGSLGANAAAVGRARQAHRAEVTGFKRNGVDYRVMVSTGLPSLRSVHIRPGAGKKGADEVIANYADGDGTVPLSSGTQRASYDADPLGEDVAISRVCKVAHMDQTSDTTVLEPLERFLERGAPPVRTQKACPLAAAELRFTHLTHPTALEVEPGGASLAPGDASLADIIPLPGATLAVTSDHRPVRLSADGEGTVVTVTPIGKDGEKGTPSNYGPITGRVSVRRDGAATTVLDDGVPVPAVEGPAPVDPQPGPEPQPKPEPAAPTGQEPAPVAQGGEHAPSPVPAVEAPRSAAPAPATRALAFTLPRLTRAALRKGVTLKVVAPGAGRVAAVLTAGRTRLTRGRATARGAGALRVRLAKVAPRRAERLKGRTVTLRVTVAGRSATRRVKVR